MTNAAFISRLADSDTVGKIDLNNATETDLINIQRVINEMLASLGIANQAATDASADTYSSNNVITDGDDRKVAIGKLDGTFDTATGHDHDGANSKTVSAANLGDFNNLFAEFGEYTFDTAVGNSIDVSALFAAQASGGDSITEGVITAAPNNFLSLLEKTTGGEIEDGEGDRVFGRLTEAAGVWTLTFYTNEAGTETAHSLSSQDIRFLYREVFTAANRPTIGANVGIYDTQSAVGDIPDAGATQRGVVSTSAQTFAGAKDFTTRPTVNSNDVLDINQAQVITNKDIDGGTASNTNRITLPKDTTTNLDLLTDKEATVAYDTTKSTVVYNDGADWKELSGGAGGGGLDVFSTQTFEDFTTVNASGNNAAFLGGGSLSGTISLETTNQIAGVQSLKYVAGAASTNDYYEVETIDLDDKQKQTTLKVRFMADMSGFAADTTFVVYDKTNSTVLSSALDIMPASEGRTFYEFSFYTADTTAQISWGFHHLVAPVNTELYLIDDIEFSTNPFISKDLVNITEWETYTPTGSWSTGTTYKGKYRRVGDSIDVKITLEITAGVTAVDFTMTDAQMFNGLGLTVDTAKLPTTGDNHNIVGVGSYEDSGLARKGGLSVAYIVSAGLIRIPTSSTSDLTNTSPITWANGDSISFSLLLPVEGWAATTEHVITPAEAGSQTYMIKQAGSALTDRVSEIEFNLGTATIENDTTYGEFLEAVDDSGSTRTQFVAIEDCIVTVQGSLPQASVNTLTGVYKNGVRWGDWNDQSSVAGSRTTIGSVVPLSKDDYITIFSDTGVQNSGSLAWITMVAIPKKVTLLAAVPVQQTGYLKDIKTAGTEGGTFTSGAWRTRDINTVSGHFDSFGTLSANQFTLTSGEYEILAAATAYEVQGHLAKLRNITDSTDVITGSSEFTNVGVNVNTKSVIEGSFTITGSKTFEIQHQCALTTASNGFGNETNFGVSETYTQVKITKVR